MRRLGLLLLVLAGLLVPVAAAPVSAGQSSALPLSTVKVDLAASQGAFPFAPGRQLSATPKSWRHGTQTLAALDALRLERARIWLRFTDTVDPATRVANYAKWHDYIATHHERARSLLVNWQTGYRDAGQCSALQGGVKARAGGPPGPERALISRNCRTRVASCTCAASV
jgi:hypothetical protein